MGRKERRAKEQRAKKERNRAKNLRQKILQNPELMNVLSELVREEQHEQQERLLFISMIALNEAHGFGITRLGQYLDAVNSNLNEYNEMRDSVDKEYADEKLRKRCEVLLRENVQTLYSRYMKPANKKSRLN